MSNSLDYVLLFTAISYICFAMYFAFTFKFPWSSLASSGFSITDLMGSTDKLSYLASMVNSEEYDKLLRIHEFMKYNENIENL